MKINALFDQTGLPLGFWTGDLYPDGDPHIPEGTVEITEEQWQEFLEHQARRRWDGTTVVPYEPPQQPEQQPQPLSELDELRARIEALEGKAP